jgi:hypothetical protein
MDFLAIVQSDKRILTEKRRSLGGLRRDEARERKIIKYTIASNKGVSSGLV